MACRHNIPCSIGSLDKYQIAERKSCPGKCFVGVTATGEPTTSFEALLDHRVDTKTCSEAWFCKCGHTCEERLNLIAHKLRCREFIALSLADEDPSLVCVCGLNICRPVSPSKLSSMTWKCIQNCAACKPFLVE